jgi:hypothetical protein
MVSSGSIQRIVALNHRITVLNRWTHGALILLNRVPFVIALYQWNGQFDLLAGGPIDAQADRVA